MTAPHSISPDILERLRNFAAFGDTAEGRILAQLALTEIERLRSAQSPEWMAGQKRIHDRERPDHYAKEMHKGGED